MENIFAQQSNDVMVNVNNNEVMGGMSLEDMYAEVDSKLGKAVALPTINLAEARKKAYKASLLARGQKISYVVLDKADPRKLVYKYVTEDDKLIAPHEIISSAMNALAAIINKAVDNKIGMIINSIDNNAITWRSYRKIAKQLGNQLDSDKVLDEMVAHSSYYQENENDTEEIQAQKIKNFEALRNFVEAMVNADKAGVYIEVRKSSEFNRLILNVPESVELKAGEILTFENGRARDGISVQGWPNFNRNHAEVKMSVGSNGNVIYYLVAKSRLTLEEMALQKVIGWQWAQLPKAAVEVDFDSVENASVNFGF